MNSTHADPNEYRDFRYDRSRLAPGWLHIGWGNFARAFIGDIADDLAETGAVNYGVIAVAPSTRQEHDVRVLNDQDNIYHLIRRNGREICQRIGAVLDVIIGSHHTAKLIDHLVSPATRLVTLTITKEGYCCDDNGNIRTDKVTADVAAMKDNRHEELQTVPVWIIAGLYTRYRQNMTPFVVMSCDNLPQNGELTFKTIMGVAAILGDDGFTSYLKDNLVIPNTAVDRITPQQNYGNQNDYLATQYKRQDYGSVVSEDHIEWIIEDKGCLPADMLTAFSKAGATFVDDITPYQDRKIRLLNGGHLLFGMLGTLLQIPTVRGAMEHKAARTLLDNFIEQTSSALEPNQPEDINDFVAATIKRFNNPHLTDQTSRLVFNTTSKVYPRLLNVEALRRGQAAESSAFAIAVWIHYLQRRDASGNPYNLDKKDNETVNKYGLDPLNPNLRKNLEAFLQSPDLGVQPSVMRDFCGQIVDYTMMIKEIGLSDAIYRAFPHKTAYSPKLVVDNTSEFVL